MTWGCDSARVTRMIRRRPLSSDTRRRVEIGIDEPQYRWMREHGALHVTDARAQKRIS